MPRQPVRLLGRLALRCRGSEGGLGRKLEPRPDAPPGPRRTGVAVRPHPHPAGPARLAAGATGLAPAEHVEDGAREQRDGPIVPEPEPLEVRRPLEEPHDEPDEACDAGSFARSVTERGARATETGTADALTKEAPWPTSTFRPTSTTTTSSRSAATRTGR